MDHYYLKQQAEGDSIENNGLEEAIRKLHRPARYLSVTLRSALKRMRSERLKGEKG